MAISQKPLVSVIVLNWNGKKFLERCISSLLRQTYSNYKIVFVDNDSTDGSVEFVKDKFGKSCRLKILSLNHNYGFAEGNNIGCKHAKGKYVIMLNNDTEVQPNFIEELVKVAETDEMVGSVGCRILQYDGKAGYTPIFTNKGFVVPFFLGASTAEDRLDKVCSIESSNLANCGCAALYRRDLFDLLGGFDKDFWSDWEDHDLGFRINIAGFKSLFTPKTIVLHVGGGAAGFSKERRTRIYRNMLFTYIKDFEVENLISRLFFFMFFLLPIGHFAWIFFNEWRIYRKKAFSYDRKAYFSLFEGYIQFLSMVRRFVKKRGRVQRLRSVSDAQIFDLTKMPCLI